MGFLSSIVKGVGKAVGTVVKSAASVASTAVKAIPGVGQIYDVATSVVGIDPIQAVGNTVGAVVGGGNIGKDIVSGIGDAVSGGLVAAFLPADTAPGNSIPEYGEVPNSVFTYPDGSYAYSTDATCKTYYNPSDMVNPPMNAVVEPNGSLTSIPASLGAKAVYIQTLLDAYGNPLGYNTANTALMAVNNFVSGQQPLSGAQQSNLIALDVVNSDPEALAYTASALQQTTGKSAIDWIGVLGGILSAAKSANIPGVNDAIAKVEGAVVSSALGYANTTFIQKVGKFVTDNVFWILGGVGVVVIAVFALGKSKK
jgi:hypothetical protein